MKNVVSIVATFALLTLLSVSTAFAQMTPPEDGAVPIGSFRAQFGADKSGPDLAYSVSSSTGGAIDVVAWMVDGGETVYTLDVNTAEFNMPCGWANQMELSAMMDMFGKAAVRKGIELGYTRQGSIVEVYYPACVARETGSGCPRLIPAPQTAYNINGYSVYGPAYNPTISLIYTICAGVSCEGNFQSTCMTGTTPHHPMPKIG